MRNYVNPSVRLIDSSVPNLGYFLWLKSRQWIITDSEGNKFMQNWYPNEDWLEHLPETFRVGDEVVNKDSYLARINSMNLQYGNTENFVFEIDGSCLFRDLLYNLNKIGMWAQSNRFLFSILDENARFEEENYHISGEYKDIPEWEEQFDKYMKAIKDDPIVDHNRIEMPYSISSTFWISINRKTLIDLLSFLKFHAPFFYEVYGNGLMRGIIQEKDLNTWIPASINQYIIKNTADWKECSVKVMDEYIVGSKMGLILYSQFIRQSDTRIAGFYNVLMHKDPEEFKHVVYKGGTIIDIVYYADETKVMHTVSNRLCAFAMSSGDDPCSWSYFLNNFLPADLTPSVLLDLLPCTWKGKTLCKCKFHDDIKFRNEGKEISNIPCPLVVKSMEAAEAKKLRDHNKIGDAYYEATKYLLSGEPEGINGV